MNKGALDITLTDDQDDKESRQNSIPNTDSMYGGECYLLLHCTCNTCNLGDTTYIVVNK